MEERLAVIGLIVGVISAILAWCSHAWYFEVITLISMCVSVFGYAYMDK
jgi:hypothetical protein